MGAKSTSLQWAGLLGMGLLLSAIQWGCGAKGTGDFTVEAGTYDQAFSATRSVLRDYRFNLERIDSRAGVITTQAKNSSGIFTPWDTEQTTIRQEFDDSINNQSRRVRVTFEGPEGSEPAADAPCVGRVEVVISRIQDYSLRPSTRAIYQSSRTVDPLASARGVWPQYEVPTTRDSKLAARIARAIEKQMAAAQADDAAEPPMPTETELAPVSETP